MIGESEDLYRRIGGFEGRARGKKYSHSEADEYSEWELSKYFPLEHLYFEYILADSKDEAERLEYELIEEYRKMYFDTPPLNKSQGKWKE